MCTYSKARGSFCTEWQRNVHNAKDTNQRVVCSCVVGSPTVAKVTNMSKPIETLCSSTLFHGRSCQMNFKNTINNRSRSPVRNHTENQALVVLTNTRVLNRNVALSSTNRNSSLIVSKPFSIFLPLNSFLLLL